MTRTRTAARVPTPGAPASNGQEAHAALAAAIPDQPASHDLVLAAVVLLGLGRLVDGPLIWLVALCALAAIGLGALQVLAEVDPSAEAAGVPVEQILLPAVAVAAGLGALRLVPFGVWLVPGVAAGGLVVARAIQVEQRILLSPGTAGPAERNAVLSIGLLIAFGGFAGVAALVPGALVDSGSATVTVPAGAELAALAAADALIALLVGYRAAALRMARARDAAWFAATAAAIIAIAAVAIRVIGVPRLAGPALLTLVFFLWDTMHGTPPARRRDARRIWELVLLVVLGVVVIVWTRLATQ
jgi:hypothetical protein